MTEHWAPEPLRLGLEPGYDGGRVGTWLFDVPGAHGWARNRDAAISQSTAVAGWWREWLERHGDRWPRDPLGLPDVVEEVPVSLVEGYERNATFVRDHEPVTRELLEASLRRLEFARADLLNLVDAAAGLAGEVDSRSGPDVLRHLADVEIWLGSRLDPNARYPGPLDQPAPRSHLDATRAWAVDNLRALQAADVAARTDGKGETWTLGKVVRRYVYHAVDHLRELDRRIARADDRVARLRWSSAQLTNVAPLVRLLRAVGWDRRTRNIDRLRRAIHHSQAVVGAWDGDELVAFAREIGDVEFNALLSMVIVDPRWQDLGLSRRLIETLMGDRPNVRFMLNSAPGIEEIYEHYGFVPDSSAMVRPRQTP